jgi:hypothetical protein
VDKSKLTTIARAGDTVELVCPIRSRPRADVQWFYQARQLVSSNNQRIAVMGDKSTLIIRNFDPSAHTGIYQCYGQNEYGSKQANLLLIPQATADTDKEAPKQRQLADQPNSKQSTGKESLSSKRPIIIMGPQNTTIYEGQTVVLLCLTSETAGSSSNALSPSSSSSSSSSSSNTQINWLQNDLIIEPTLMRRFEINQLLGNLKIVSIQKSDSGIYKCIASNEYGMSTAEAYVQVKSSSANKAANGNFFYIYFHIYVLPELYLLLFSLLLFFTIY